METNTRGGGLHRDMNKAYNSHMIQEYLTSLITAFVSEGKSDREIRIAIRNRFDVDSDTIQEIIDYVKNQGDAVPV
jgi:hypothetical protein